MPELPEVETTVLGLKSYLIGSRVIKVIFHRNNIRYPLNKNWIEYITDKSIISIYRRAKIIIMKLEDGGYLLWHLGMTGSLRISKQNEVKRQHDHIEFILDSNNVLRYHDPRRFGYLKWFADKLLMDKSIAHYGIEPLSDDFNYNYLWQKSRYKKQPVKNFIMNQNVVVGIGNIYACEALFLAAILPQTRCGAISKKCYLDLVKSIKSVLCAAISKGGTTISDFENADASPGYFQQFLSVYGRDKKPCLNCKTEIKSIKLGGRNSFYCPHCQK